MSKRIAIQLDKTIAALNAIELEQHLAYATQDKRTKAAKAALATASEAKHLADALSNVWKTPLSDLQKLQRIPSMQPIVTLIAEVIAAKLQARQRRKVEQARVIAQAFSLEARCHIRKA